MEEKPTTIEQYLSWLNRVHKVRIDERYQAYYESATSKAKRDVQASQFWIQLTNNITDYDQKYRLTTGYPLFTSKYDLELLIKPFDSFLLKTFRKNVLENNSWPDEPEGGWILPENWFSRINDVIRTLFVVKYFDGVNFIKNAICTLCQEQSMHCEVSYEAREEGYYAVHTYTRQSVEIPKIDWDTKRVDLYVEMQITTQLQEVIRRLLHKYYEERRKMVGKPAEKWQWNCRSEEFSANYLGHILHYVEGMILEIREKQKEKKT